MGKGSNMKLNKVALRVFAFFISMGFSHQSAAQLMVCEQKVEEIIKDCTNEVIAARDASNFASSALAQSSGNGIRTNAANMSSTAGSNAQLFAKASARCQELQKGCFEACGNIQGTEEELQHAASLDKRCKDETDNGISLAEQGKASNLDAQQQAANTANESRDQNTAAIEGSSDMSSESQQALQAGADRPNTSEGSRQVADSYTLVGSDSSGKSIRSNNYVMSGNIDNVKKIMKASDPRIMNITVFKNVYE